MMKKYRILAKWEDEESPSGYFLVKNLERARNAKTPVDMLGWVWDFYTNEFREAGGEYFSHAPPWFFTLDDELIELDFAAIPRHPGLGPYPRENE